MNSIYHNNNGYINKSTSHYYFIMRIISVNRNNVLTKQQQDVFIFASSFALVAFVTLKSIFHFILNYDLYHYNSQYHYPDHYITIHITIIKLLLSV